MKQTIILLSFLICFLSARAQTTVYKKIAQRSDDYVNNNWVGKDSFLYTYNVDTALLLMHKLAFTNNNWNNEFRYTYTINANGKIDVQIRENWNGNAWVNSTQYLYTYDGSGNNTTINYNVWGGAAWNPTGKIEYAGFNNYGKWFTEILSNYSGGNWVNQTKKERTYINNDTLVAEDNRYLWSIANNQWKKQERLFYTYVQGEVGSITRLLPDAAEVWQPINKYTYTYNLSPFRITQYLSQNYDTVIMGWANANRLIYNYTVNDLLDKTQNETSINNNWTPVSRAQYLYNGNNEKIENYTETYNNGNWDKTARSTYVYTNTKVTEENQFVGVANNWQPSMKLSYSYNADTNLVYEKSEDYTGGNFIPASQSFYYYGAYVVGINDVEKLFSKLVLYPNPAIEKLFIQIESEKSTQLQINITDMMGKVHLIRVQSAVQGSHTIDIPVASLSNGFYLAEIIDLKNSKRQIEKFQIGK